MIILKNLLKTFKIVLKEFCWKSINDGKGADEVKHYHACSGESVK